MQFSDRTVSEAELAVVDLVFSQAFLHTQLNAAVWRVRLSEHLCDSKIEERDGGPL